MIDVTSLTFRRFQRARAASPFNLPDRREPLTAHRAEASDDALPPSPGASSHNPRGPAVEAGRSANPSDRRDECGCTVCSSDLAGIVPCALNEDI